MKIYFGCDDNNIRKKKRGMAIGIFDGVHRGHQKIIQALLNGSKEYGLKPMVVTFDPHPNKILKPTAHHPILMSLSHRLYLLGQLGVEETLVIQFDRKFSKISADFFLEKILLDRLGIKLLVMGGDFCFGAGGEGDKDFLTKKSGPRGFKLRFVEPLKYRGKIVSSTKIRSLIEKGSLKNASGLLGRPVSVRGDVVHGYGRGASLLGYPTANIDPHHETLPPDGIYAAWGWVNNKKVKGVIHIGPRPTFHEMKKSLEVFFLNFHRDIYGKEIELFFVSKIRGIKKFSTPHELTLAIQEDVRAAKKIFSRI